MGVHTNCIAIYLLKLIYFAEIQDGIKSVYIVIVP